MFFCMSGLVKSYKFFGTGRTGLESRGLVLRNQGVSVDTIQLV